MIWKSYQIPVTLNFTMHKLGLALCIWLCSNKVQLQFTLVRFWIIHLIQMHSLGLWGTDHQYSIRQVQIWARSKSHLFARSLQALNWALKLSRSKKLFMTSNQTNLFAAMDTANIKPKVFWSRPTTVSKRDSVKTTCPRGKWTTQWNSSSSQWNGNSRAETLPP